MLYRQVRPSRAARVAFLHCGRRTDAFMTASSFSRIASEEPGRRRKNLEANVSTEQRLPEADPRVQGSHEHQGRATRPEKKKSQGKKAPGSLRDQPNLRFPPSFRVRSRFDFLKVQGSGRKVRGRCFILLTVENDLPFSRFGITVSKKNGNAVKRNRIKRKIREIQRVNRKEIVSGRDIVVIARRQAAEASFTEMESEYLRLARLANLMEKG